MANLSDRYGGQSCKSSSSSSEQTPMFAQQNDDVHSVLINFSNSSWSATLVSFPVNRFSSSAASRADTRVDCPVAWVIVLLHLEWRGVFGCHGVVQKRNGVHDAASMFLCQRRTELQQIQVYNDNFVLADCSSSVSCSGDNESSF